MKQTCFNHIYVYFDFGIPHIDILFNKYKILLYVDSSRHLKTSQQCNKEKFYPCATETVCNTLWLLSAFCGAKTTPCIPILRRATETVT